jgi:hypothetical protein
MKCYDIKRLYVSYLFVILVGQPFATRFEGCIRKKIKIKIKIKLWLTVLHKLQLYSPL